MLSVFTLALFTSCVSLSQTLKSNLSKKKSFVTFVNEYSYKVSHTKMSFAHFKFKEERKQLIL